MKKQDLLEYFDDDLLDKLFGFCYARTSDSHEAEELCSDIVYALLKAAHRNGEIEVDIEKELDKEIDLEAEVDLK